MAANYANDFASDAAILFEKDTVDDAFGAVRAAFEQLDAERQARFMRLFTLAAGRALARPAKHISFQEVCASPALHGPFVVCFTYYAA